MRVYLGKLAFLQPTAYVDIVEAARSSSIPPTEEPR